MKTVKVNLSKRNLLTLLSKLERQEAGDTTLCTIIKCDTAHPLFPQNVDQIIVTAVPDGIYYAHRSPGEMHPLDTPKDERTLQ